MSADWACRRCGRPVGVSRADYDTFEQMHWVCFHFEFEHGETDVDSDCGIVGCPCGVLPSARPSDDALAVMAEVIDALRSSDRLRSWVLDVEAPGIASLKRPGASVRVVAADAGVLGA